MDEGVCHIKDLLRIFRENDGECKLVNRFETETGGGKDDRYNSQ